MLERVLARGARRDLLRGREVCSSCSVPVFALREERHILRIWVAWEETMGEMAGRMTPVLDAAEKATEELMMNG